jgi:hypothetical protein
MAFDAVAWFAGAEADDDGSGFYAGARAAPERRPCAAPRAGATHGRHTAGARARGRHAPGRCTAYTSADNSKRAPMTHPSPAGSPGGGSAVAGGGSEPWQATRALTQVARDEDAYLGSGRRDIGRAVGDNRHELFVACEAGLALRQQFEHLRPEFIAVHDVATVGSRKLVAGIAAAGKGAVQRLVIRRQGQGEPLATLDFTEVSTAEGTRVRVYATDSQAEPATREAIARTLLAFSTLGAILVGDVPGASIGSVFEPLHAQMVNGPWPNRKLLLLPLSTANPLVNQGMDLARGTGVQVRTTPQVARPADAWNFISRSWAQAREQAGGVRPPSPASLGEDVLGRYLDQLGRVTGMVSCCIFEVSTGRPLLHAGARPGPADLAEHGAELMAAMLTTSRRLGLGPALPDAALTLAGHHLVLRPVPRHPGLALHAVLDKGVANLTLARLQIGRMDSLFGETPAA